MGRLRQAELRTTFLVDRCWQSVLSKMSDGQVAQWTRAVWAFANGLEPKVTDDKVQVLFEVFTSAYCAHEEQYRAKCEHYAEAARDRQARQREQLAELERVKAEYPQLFGEPSGRKGKGKG